MRPAAFLTLAAAASLLAAAAPAHASHRSAYRDSVRCDGKTVRSVQLDTRTREAAVFQKVKTTRSGTFPYTYACLVRGGSIERLDDPARSYRAFDAALAGRFAGYELEDLSDQFTVPSTLAVVDLKAGVHRRISASPNAEDRDVSVRTFVLKRNGAVAWIAAGDPSGDQAVFKEDTSTVAPQQLDAAPGPEFDPRSLRLSADRRTVLWRRTGERADRSATLR